MSALADEIKAALREVLRDELPRFLADIRARPDQRPARIGVREAAALADRHSDTIRRAIKAGKLAATKPRGAREWVLDTEDVERWVRGDTTIARVDMRAEVQAAVARALDRKPDSVFCNI